MPEQNNSPDPRLDLLRWWSSTDNYYDDQPEWMLPSDSASYLGLVRRFTSLRDPHSFIQAYLGNTMPTPPEPVPAPSVEAEAVAPPPPEPTEAEPTEVEAEADITWTCDCCDEGMTDDDPAIRTDSGTYICDHCRHSAYTACDRCDDVCPDDEVRTALNAETGRRPLTCCDSCTFLCHGCDESFYGYLSEHNNRSYCNACFNETFSTCRNCGDVEYQDDLRNGYCDECRSDEDNEDERDGLPPPLRNVRHDYSFAPPLLMFRSPAEASIHPDGRLTYFGLEIEVEFPHGWGLASAAPVIKEVVGEETLWYAKADGSLTNGAEFVSHPSTLDFWRKTGFEWATTLRKKGFRSWNTATCGIHIHVSRDALPVSDWVKTGTFFRNAPSLVGRMARRTLNHYCEIRTGEQRREILHKVHRRAFPGYRGDRYQALNFCPENTAEFRIFRGTLCASSILLNLEIVNSILEFARRHTPTQMTEERYLHWLKFEVPRIPSIGPKRADFIRAWVDPSAPANIRDRWKNRTAATPDATNLITEH